MRHLAPLVAGLLTAFAGRPAVGQTPFGLTLRDTAVLAAPQLGESSGLAASRRPGTYWTINDSGNKPLLYLTDSTGADRGRLRIQGARNVDWEDLAAGPCPPPTRGRCLYVADIGDNGARRKSITVYVLREPELPNGPADTTRIVPLLGAAHLRYAGGPRDAEGLAVRGPGTVLLATKPRSGEPELYEVALQLGATRVVRSHRTLPVPANPITGALVTGIAFAANGGLLAVRTYRHLHFFRLGGPSLERFGPAGGALIPVVESQGEAVTFEGPGRLVLSSERGYRGHAILTRVLLTGFSP